MSRYLIVAAAIMLPVFTFLAVASALERQEKWRMLGKCTGCTAYYDEASLMRRNNGQLVTVWTKSYVTPACEQFSAVKTELAAKKIAVTEFDHLLSLIEMDCRSKRYRTLANVMRSKNEKVLSVAEFLNAEWEEMSGENVLATLSKSVCK